MVRSIISCLYSNKNIFMRGKNMNSTPCLFSKQLCNAESQLYKAANAKISNILQLIKRFFRHIGLLVAAIFHIFLL